MGVGMKTWLETEMGMRTEVGLTFLLLLVSELYLRRPRTNLVAKRFQLTRARLRFIWATHLCLILTGVRSPWERLFLSLALPAFPLLRLFLACLVHNASDPDAWSWLMFKAPFGMPLPRIMLTRPSSWTSHLISDIWLYLVSRSAVPWLLPLPFLLYLPLGTWFLCYYFPMALVNHIGRNAVLRLAQGLALSAPGPHSLYQLYKFYGLSGLIAKSFLSDVIWSINDRKMALDVLEHEHMVCSSWQGPSTALPALPVLPGPPNTRAWLVWRGAAADTLLGRAYAPRLQGALDLYIEICLQRHSPVSGPSALRHLVFAHNVISHIHWVLREELIVAANVPAHIAGVNWQFWYLRALLLSLEFLLLGDPTWPGLQHQVDMKGDREWGTPLWDSEQMVSHARRVEPRLTETLRHIRGAGAYYGPLTATVAARLFRRFRLVEPFPDAGGEG